VDQASGIEEETEATILGLISGLLLQHTVALVKLTRHTLNPNATSQDLGPKA